MTRISVIVPVCNVAPYVHHCIDSILESTYSDFEALLVDDGSSDESSSACDEYAYADARVCVVHKTNGGVSSARNAGIEVVKGEYVTFCDGDDYWTSSWLSELNEAMKQSGADLVCGGRSMVDESGDVLSSWVYRESGTTTLFLDTPETHRRHIIQDILSANVKYSVWIRLFRSSIVHGHGVRFCETCENFAENLCFVLEYSLYCKCVSFIPSCGYMYVQHAGSSTHRNADKIRLNAMNEISLQFARRIMLNDFDVPRSFVPIIHHLIMNRQYSRIHGSPRAKELALEIAKIQEADWFWQQTKALKGCKVELRNLYGKGRAWDILSFNDYILNGNWLLYRIRYLPHRIWHLLYRIKHHLASHDRRKALARRMGRGPQ